MNKKNQALQSTVYGNMRHGLNTVDLLLNMDVNDMDIGLEMRGLARLAQNPDDWDIIFKEEKYCERKYFFITALQLPIPPNELFDIMTQNLRWMHMYAMPYLAEYIIKNEALDTWLSYVEQRSAKSKRGLLTLGYVDCIKLLQKYPLPLLLPHLDNKLTINLGEFEDKTGGFLYTGDAVRDLVIAMIFEGALNDFFVGHYHDDPLWLHIAHAEYYTDEDIEQKYPLLNIMPFETNEEKIQAYTIWKTQNDIPMDETDLCLS